VRYFNSAQLNIYLISVIARAKLPRAAIEKVEGTLKTQLEKLHAEVNEAIDGAEALCKIHGITRLATYDTEPLAIEVKVISSFGRRYLELMTKVDRLMPMLETLAIDDVIEVSRLDLQKALAKKSVRQVAGAARNFAAGLRQRMNAIAEGDAARSDSARRDESEARALLSDAHVCARTDVGAAVAIPGLAAVDSHADAAANSTTPPARNVRALTSESASQANAAA
jgi:hypothetical protein